jgi:lipoprotein NlpD
VQVVEPGSDDAPLGEWHWPARGRVVRRFGSAGSNGIDIAGRPGQPVRAASAGRVVYSGGGLRGYGELIIVKHNKRYLSAYAHNEEALVKEGDIVAGGQRIATIGRTGTDRVKLHFEIRRDGKPVNPLRYLPK